MKVPPRAMILPGVDRPSWVEEENEDLLYLGWGRRFFHRQPIPVTRHIGWPYLVVTMGQPQLALLDRKIPARAGTVFLVGPDCATGWVDSPGKTCRILSWIWRNGPPGASRTDTLTTGFVDRDAITRLEHLHRDTRREVAITDQYSTGILRGIRAILDNEFLRAFQTRPEPVISDRQLGLAANWMRLHLDSRHPVRLLGEYLDVTKTQLSALFVNGTGMSPHAYFQSLRMQHARDLLGKGLQAKAVARVLGYGHPNDLSRAYQRYYHKSIRDSVKRDVG